MCLVAAAVLAAARSDQGQPRSLIDFDARPQISPLTVRASGESVEDRVCEWGMGPHHVTEVMHIGKQYEACRGMIWNVC